MATRRDIEHGSMPGEREPLLAPQQSAGDATAPLEDNSAPEPQSEASKRREYGWRGFWIVVAVLIVAVFVKGWIESDDVDVSTAANTLRPRPCSRVVAVRSQRSSEARSGWWTERRGSNGLASLAVDADSDHHELPVSSWDIVDYCNKDALPGRWLRQILRGYGGSAVSGYVPSSFKKVLPHQAYHQPGPIARFGDTAANAGILALLQSNGYLAGLPSPIKTIFASLCAAGFRMILTPIDTLKTTLQAEGSRGTALLRQRIKTDGIGSLWWGAFATAAATFVGHYPWFATYNFLSENITEPPRSNIVPWLLRAAFIGFCASVVSDTISNSLRVVKTYRQVHEAQVSYTEAARRIIRQDGRRGLFGRGLKTRIIANGLQGILFSILWKLFLKIWEDKTGNSKSAH